MSLPSPTRPRRSPFVAGTLLLVLAAGLVAPVAWLMGWHAWPLALGLLAGLLLLFGVLERLWQWLSGLLDRRAFQRARASERGRFKVLAGGKGKRKGNGHDHDTGEGPDGPGWVM